MKRKFWILAISAVLVTSTLAGCSSKQQESTQEETRVSSSDADEKKKTEDKNEESKKEKTDDKDDTSGNKASGENENQIGKGVNGDIPEPDYSYEGIINAPAGLYPSPHQKKEYSLQQWGDIKKEWKKGMQAEVDKIEKPLGADATDKDIDHFFNQLLYIAASDYSAIEEINRFSYVIFKNDMEDPFTKQSIAENKQINVEIVLDASGSMAKKIDGQTMMNIAKNSITEVLKQLPQNAKVGLRVFGHRGNNKDSGKAESCGANELIYPIETLNPEGITAALALVEPTGWTSIADSIKNGVEDLSVLEGENTVNILYIITDGIETCGGDPVAAAKEMKNKGTNIVFGIIGFNVNASQDALLKEIAKAGEGYYANAGDAGTLTAELYTISEAANSLYNWEPFTQTLYLNRVRSHKSGILYNKYAVSGTYGYEKAGLDEAIQYAQSKGLVSKENGVYKKLQEKAEKRQSIIKQVLEEEYKKRETQSQEYLAYLEGRIGEEVAIVETTSRVDPFSNYYIGPAGVGGSMEDAQKDGEKLNSEQEESMKNE